MSKKLTFCVVDTETATMPFANEIAATPEEKKAIAIAKPLIYDIGWVITDRQGNHIQKRQYLIAETFCVPAIFNTAYYVEKRPIYLEMLSRGETTIKPWDEVMEIFMEDLRKVDSVGAFNSMFDFKKAIPFTECYIRHLYSPNYYKWEETQKEICRTIATNKKKAKKETDFENDIFRFRGETFKLFDIWGLATTHLLNNVTYKNECINHGLFTASGIYFKTSAETSYQYLCNKYDFVESHTALDDAIIETYILSKIAQRHAVENGIKYFPFRDLGYTDKFVMERKHPNRENARKVYDAIADYVESKMDETEELSNYCRGLVKRLQVLADYAALENRFTVE